jgi:hypothetical protein
MLVEGWLVDNLYWWDVCYTEAVIETDQNLKMGRIYEAIAALEQRLLSPVEPGSDESIKLTAARADLQRLKSENCHSLTHHSTETADA